MSNKAYELLRQLEVGMTEEGRAYHSGTITLNNSVFRTLTMMILGRISPYSEANLEGAANSKTAAFVLDNLGEILSRTTGKLLYDGLIKDVSVLSPDICMIFDVTHYIYRGANVDVCVKFMTGSSRTGQPTVYNVMFHFPRDEGNYIKYQFEGLLSIAEKE